MTTDELETKARNIARMSMSAEKFERIIEAVHSLETLRDMRSLGDLLRD